MATPTGMVFGGSRGQAAEDIMLDPRYEYAPNFYLGYVNETEVTIGTESNGGPRLYGQVFGGGRDGHVRGSAHVIVNDGTIGQTYAETAVGGKDAEYHRYHRGNVYGAGSGLGLWATGKHGMSSGSVTRNTTVDINGGTIYNNVYGGGALSSVGPPRIDLTKDYAPDSISRCVVNINGGTIGQTAVYESYKYGGCVFGASRGNDFVTDTETGKLLESPENFATVLWTQVNINGGSIAGNVYGGAKGGIVWKDAEVNMKGGRIYHNAYGGGQGTDSIAANVGGNTTVKLNEGKTATSNGCIVEKVFGCNDLNGTPKGHTLVHVYATQHRDSTNIGAKSVKFRSMEGGYTTAESGEGSYKAKTNADDLGKLAQTVGLTSGQITDYETAISGAATDSLKKVELNKYIEAIADRKYDVLAVYGGGNLAMYEPTDLNEATDVIIDGCALTSIKQVYGGGNAASTPATNVRINAAYEIHEAFGGGNGKDVYEINNEWYENPGANVGYYATFHHTSAGGTTQGNPHPAVENNGSDGYKDATTKDARRANYPYGKGTTRLEITGGRIHTTYGGSNTRGNIRAEAFTGTEDAGDCDMIIDKSYTAGKSADTDAGSKVEAKCVEQKQDAIYGGSMDANVYSDVVIDITNGTFGKVYGGNDTRGKIYGSITINVHEEGCKPIVIDSLYVGGKLADYSVYGFNDNGTARTKAQYEALTPAQQAEITVQRDPQINIISATKIGSIYGGGYEAKVIGNPSINVNMEKGKVLAKYANAKPTEFTVETHHSSDGYDYEVVSHPVDGDAILAIGTIGTIYGGGFKGDVLGNTSVEIGTGEWLNQNGQRETTDADGKVYTYNSETNKWDWTKKVGDITESGTVDNKPAPARNAATITGNVFGGGEGEALNSGDRAFFCESAMVGVDGDGIEHPDGGTSVIIANGTVGTLEDGKLKAGTGNVYGGGELGRVEKNTVVTIGVTPKEGETIDDTKFKPTIYGSVFGAGKGVATHGYSALVRGNSTVTIQGFAKVGESVYGGGEVASVGRYNVIGGVPTSLKNENSGNCIVTTMFHVDGSGNIVANDQPDNSGHVFGAGKGAMPGIYTFSGNSYPYHMTLNANGNSVWETITTEEAYLRFIETLGLATQTDVTIGGKAFVKGDVFGGAEQGFVQHDTHVTIEGDCQIGNGYVQMNDAGTYLARKARYSLNRRYTDAEWEAGHLIKDGETNYSSSLPECASDNGSTFYGNVFGGGSGYFPYAAGKWHWKAGDVGGNTVVDIKGGHILTNVYGGNELTNVTGKSTVNMSGGTIGVPRTLGQIAAHPVTCYLFGGGKGDPRVLFNKQTNVNDVEVNISGGWIYGSVFGGGEDGHVMRDVTMNIGGNEVDNTKTDAEVYNALYAGSATKIGTWGTSYVDGNVFGGGRGFAGDAYTAGNVAGSVDMTISGGTMLGSVYGGGRLGSVGYGLYDEGADGYGLIRDDKKMDDGTDGSTFFTNGRGE